MDSTGIQPQLGLTTYNNQSLFSDHYLHDILRTTAVWRSATEQGRDFLAWLRDLYAKEQAQLPLYKEAQLEDNWLRHIFNRLGHVWEGQATIPGLKGSISKPDYAFFPDEAARKAAVGLQNTADYAQAALALGEVKQWEVNLSKKTGSQPTFDAQNPMFQIDTYLTLTGVEWGILSNGRFWRLVHKNSSRTLETYFEIDLLAALHAPDETFATAVAAYFWLFFNQSSFRPDGKGRTFLDEALEQSRAYALALEADLRDNAYRSLEQLIIGFFAGDSGLDAQNSADRDEVYRNSLYLLYRLLFIFYGESRALLPMHHAVYREQYSLQQLAQKINAKRNSLTTQPTTGKFYWNQLRELFRLISGHDEQLNTDLGVPRYNGGLFDPAQHPFLEQHFVGDRALALAIDYLATRRIIEAGGKPAYQTVDYRTLDVRQLGSIYEGLLEYRVAVATDEMVTISQKGTETWVPAAQKGKAKTYGERRQAGELYLTTDKGERKATGSYYTPDYIVEYIVANTLGPLVEQVREGVKAQVRQTGSLDAAERERQSAVLFTEGILALNVLDPAMGSGHFLVEATNYLARALATDDYVQAGADETDLLYWKRRVVEACIYGVDKNPMAVELAKLSLWLKTAAADKPLSFLDHHLRHGDSLVGAWLADLRRAPGQKAGAQGNAGAGEQMALFNEEAFTQDAGLAVKGLAGIERLPTEDIEDVHRKETVWRDIQREHLARWRTLADVWTSAYFGNALTPEEYRALAATTQGQDSLMSEEQAAQFLGHTAVTDNDYFHWQLAFPEVFFDEYGRSLADAAGFDAVIGNPPYARIQILSKEASSYFSQVFGAATGSYDLYVLFIEKGIVLLNDRGLFGYIVPNKFFRVDYGVGIRRVLSSGGHVKKIVDFGTAQVFGEEATTYTSLLFLEHTPTEQEIPYWSLKGQDSKTIADMSVSESWMQTIFDNDDLGEDPWNFHGQQSKRIIDKLAIKSAPLGAFTAAIARGLSTGNDSVFVVEVVEEGATISRVKSQVESTTFEIENTLLRIPIFASDFQKYSFRLSHVQKVICPYDIASNELLAEDEFRDSFPLTWSYLSQHEGKLRERAQYSKWYGYSAPRNLDTNTNANFLIPLLAFDPAFSPYPVPQTEYVLMASGGFGISVRNDLEYHASYLIALINSRLLFFVLRAISNVFRGGYITCTKQYFEKLPVLEIDFSTPKEQRTAVLTTAKTHYEQGDHPAVLAWATAELAAGRNDTIHDLLAFLAEQMIAMNKEKQAALEAFWLDLEGFTDADTFAKLRDKGKWEQSLYKAVPAARPFVSEESRSTVTLDASLGWGVDAYKGFVKDLAGTVKGLSHIVGVYHDHAPTVGELNGRLADTDALIDQLVYKLYGLNAEEIAIVEGRG